MKVENWKGTISYHPHSVEKVTAVEDIVRIVRDTTRYPSPVRAKGSHHSTTKCIVAEGGTVLDMTAMNRTLHIDKEQMTITMEAGKLHLDAARELEAAGLQFYVNVEIGNMTVGSGACCGTKDASYFSGGAWEFGQVASYVVGMKLVQADGSILEVTEESDPELMVLLRSSYGMLGVVYEVTFKVKPLQAMKFEHRAYLVDEFADKLDSLVKQDKSMMLYLFPFRNRVVVEYRSDGEGSPRSGTWQWAMRNYSWKTISPAWGKVVTRFIPGKWLKSKLVNVFNFFVQLILVRLIRGSAVSPADQIIRYPEKAGFASYTFSIWSFPMEEYPETIKAYFKFCRDYFQETGYRCDMLNVGYHIAQDNSSLFSYTRKGPALTLDPVSTGSAGWPEFLTAYNEFCGLHHGTPLFNQTRGITPAQAKMAFGEEIGIFQNHRRQMDPGGRFYTPYFQYLFE